MKSTVHFSDLVSHTELQTTLSIISEKNVGCDAIYAEGFITHDAKYACCGFEQNY